MKETREGEKRGFGSGSVAREGEIKVPSFPAASSRILASPPHPPSPRHRHWWLFCVLCPLIVDEEDLSN